MGKWHSGWTVVGHEANVHECVCVRVCVHVPVVEKR
jgi:hypothetical protein